MYLGLYAALLLLVRGALGLFYFPPLWMTLLALVPGIAHYLAAILYTKAMMTADASTVLGVTQINPVFALGWGFLIFSDFFLPLNYAGVFLIVVCALGLALERSSRLAKGFQLNQAFGLILLATFFRSISDLTLKMTLNELDYWNTFGLSRLALLVPAVIVFSFRGPRQIIVEPIRRKGYGLLLVIGFIELGAMANLLVLTKAYSLGPLALVSATQSTAPMFVLGLTVGLNYLKPGLIPARDTGSRNWLKLLLCLGIVTGVYLLHFE